jgi:signal transduction histidine kinase
MADRLVRLTAAEDNRRRLRPQHNGAGSATRAGRGQERNSVSEFQEQQRDQITRSTLNRVMAAVYWPLLFLNVTVLVLLGVSGFPTARVVAVGAVLTVHLGMHVFYHRFARRQELSEKRFTPLVFVMWGTQLSILALTGGLGSPFLPIIISMLANNTAIFGRVGLGRLGLPLTLSTIAICAFLPTEPAVPAPYNLVLYGISVVFVIVVLRRTLLQIRDAYVETGTSLAQAREDLLASARERAGSLEQLTSKVSHELKNPLAAIKGLTQILYRSSEDERARERLTVIGDTVTHMEAILRDYLSFSRPLQELQREPVDPGQLCDEVLAVLEARAAAAGVRVSRTGEPCSVEGDPRRLKEALLNLLSNALESMPQGGDLDVAVEQRGEQVTVVIRDSGRGMSAEALARLGTPFFTTRAEGTGLGVVLAKGVARQHGGDVTYASEVDRGTTATMNLPVRAPAVTAEQSHA